MRHEIRTPLFPRAEGKYATPLQRERGAQQLAQQLPPRARSESFGNVAFESDRTGVERCNVQHRPTILYLNSYRIEILLQARQGRAGIRQHRTETMTADFLMPRTRGVGVFFAAHLVIFALGAMSQFMRSNRDATIAG